MEPALELCIEISGYSLAMSSLVVFSINVRRLAAFYETVLGARPIDESTGDVRLINERDEVLIHSIPKKISKDIKITSPPAPRENSALKPVFDVVSLERALESVEATGGVVTSRGFSFDGMTRRDVLDPDGNIIQLRCRIS
jgi:catechol 2,3-dioxygenase-like lactoylglutathione lyase family enzyme